SIRHEGGAWQLDHGPDHVFDRHAVFAHHLTRHFVNQLRLLMQLFTQRNERHHDLELDLLAFTLHLARRFEDRATLHASHFRKQQPETTTTEAQHRISFANAIHLSQQRALVIDLIEHVVHVDQRACDFQFHLQLGELAQQLFGIWQKLMQRRIEKTNRDRKSGHLAKDADEIAALERQQLLKCFFARADALRENHLAHSCETLIAEEHMLRATEPDSFRAKPTRRLRVKRRISVCTHAQAAEVIGPRHEFVKISSECRLNRRHLAEKDATSRAINRDPLTFRNNSAVDSELLLAVIDIQRL